MLPLDAVLPAFLIAVAGYFTKNKLHLDTGSLSRVCLYILTPALAFNSLSTSQMSFSVAWRISLCAMMMAPLLWPIFTLFSRLFRSEPQTARSLALPAVVFRLILGPMLMAGVGFVVGLKGLPWQVMVLQAAMPSPVNATILAREFNAQPSAVSKATLINTIGSVLTLTIWIVLLRRFPIS